jgi:hypothetical protein
MRQPLNVLSKASELWKLHRAAIVLMQSPVRFDYAAKRLRGLIHDYLPKAHTCRLLTYRS